MKNEEKAVKLFRGITGVGDDIIEEAGNAQRRKKAPVWRRWGALAACLCLVLAGTAFASSPGLREMLSAALGGFAPYAVEQESETYVIDGIEFRVVSTLADDFTVRAYIEARDLEGGRLSRLALNTLGSVSGYVEIPKDETNVMSYGSGGMCLDYNEDTETALLVITTQGQVPPEDLSGSEVRLSSLQVIPYPPFWNNSEGVAFPVEIEPLPSLIADAELASALQAEEVRLSALGLSVVFKADGAWVPLAGMDISVRLKDGTLVEAPWTGGQGSFGAYGTESSRKVLIWNFREPVAPEQIEGIYMGEDYFPMN